MRSRSARARSGGPDLAARPRSVPALAPRRCQSPRQGRASGAGSGGLHRLALRGGGDRGGGLRGAPGRTGGHQAARGPKRRAKTDRSDARLLRELLQAGELPESWIPPRAVLEWRERVRLYLSLVNQRTVWCQRIHAELYQHGVAIPEGAIRADKTRANLADDGLRLSPAARERITVGYRMIDATDAEAQPLKRQLQLFGTKQPACQALVAAQYGIGGLIAVAVWSELGDCRRFSRSEQAVRHTGLDVTVDSSDRRRAGGFLSREGPETLRWALYEAAKNSSHHRSPDHDCYTTLKQRHDGKIAAISVARKLARRCYHVLRQVDSERVYAMPD
jgi:transposase